MFFLGSPLTLTYKIDDPLVIKMFVIPLHGNREGGGGILGVLGSGCPRCVVISAIILLHQKFLQFDWLREVVFQLNLKYLHVKITNLLWVVV